MSVYQEDNGKWAYRFMRQGQRPYAGGFATEEAARDAEAAKRKELKDRELYPETMAKADSAAMLVPTIVEWYETHFIPTKDSKSSMIAYARFAKEYFAGRTIESLQNTDVLAFRTRAGELVNREGRQISRQTVNHYHKFMRAVLNAAIKGYRTASHAAPPANNPFAHVAIESLPAGAPRFLYSIEERLLDSWILDNEPRLYPYFLTGLLTGSRLEALALLLVEEIDLNIQDIFWRDAKGHSSYHSPISDRLAAFLRPLLADKGPKERALGAFHPSTVSAMFRRALKSTGLYKQGISFHSLRHTFAERLLAAGVDIYVVSRLLNHSSVAITQKIYGHLAQQTKLDAVNKIDAKMTINNSQAK